MLNWGLKKSIYFANWFKKKTVCDDINMKFLN